MTQYTVFISDTHLNQYQPAITQRLIDFLHLNKTVIEKLYLLGDLFDVWLGDDDFTPLNQKISQALMDCTQTGVSVYFVHGNRDYLIGKNFAQACGMTLLKEITLISLYGQRTLLMHGDLLCSDDHAYQRYRCIMLSPWMKKISLALPLWLRQKIAEKLRKVSHESNTIKTISIMDVVDASVVSVLKENHATLLIHGHTHRPGCHRMTEPCAQRIVLGAWENTQGNAIIASKKTAPCLINFDQAPLLTALP